MERGVRFLTIVILALVLSACGLLAGLIPDQSIDDPFGLDGTVVTVSRPNGDLAPLTDQLSGSFTATVESLGIAGLPPLVTGAVSPSSISDVLSIRQTVQVAAPGEVAFAPSYAITAARVSLEVFDGNRSVLSHSWSADDLALRLDGSAQVDGEGNTSGLYTAQLDVPLVELELAGQRARNYFRLLTTEGSYTVEGSIVLQLEPSFPAGAEMTVTLLSLGGTLAF
jgi:hypothetical protein